MLADIRRFGSFFFKAGRPAGPTAEMVAELAGVGIRPKSPHTAEELVSACREQEFANDFRGSPYLALLLKMGDWQGSPSEPIWYFSDDVYLWDCEWIEDQWSYAKLVARLCDLSSGDLEYEAIGSHYDDDNEQAHVLLGRNGRLDRIDLEFDRDLTDPRIFEILQRDLTASGSTRVFANHNLGQACLIICKTPDEIGRIRGLTGLRFRTKVW